MTEEELDLLEFLFKEVETKPAVSEEQSPFILLAGPRGVKWLEFQRPIDNSNPLYFTCAECRKTTAGSEEPSHEKGCKVALMNMLGM